MPTVHVTISTVEDDPSVEGGEKLDFDSLCLLGSVDVEGYRSLCSLYQYTVPTPLLLFIQRSQSKSEKGQARRCSCLVCGSPLPLSFVVPVDMNPLLKPAAIPREQKPIRPAEGSGTASTHIHLYVPARQAALNGIVGGDCFVGCVVPRYRIRTWDRVKLNTRGVLTNILLSTERGQSVHAATSVAASSVFPCSPNESLAPLLFQTPVLSQSHISFSLLKLKLKNVPIYKHYCFCVLASYLHEVGHPVPEHFFPSMIAGVNSSSISPSSSLPLPRSLSSSPPSSAALLAATLVAFRREDVDGRNAAVSADDETADDDMYDLDSWGYINDRTSIVYVSDASELEDFLGGRFGIGGIPCDGVSEEKRESHVSTNASAISRLFNSYDESVRDIHTVFDAALTPVSLLRLCSPHGSSRVLSAFVGSLGRRPHTLLISGASGAGKSHLVRNLIRLWRPSEGSRLSPSVRVSHISVTFASLSRTAEGLGNCGLDGALAHIWQHDVLPQEPCVVLLDNMQTLFPQGAETDRERSRLLYVFLSAVQALPARFRGRSDDPRVLVVGLTPTPADISPTMKKLFDVHVLIPSPTTTGRKSILDSLLFASSLPSECTRDLTPLVDTSLVASLTNGFLGADLLNLTRYAWAKAYERAGPDAGFRGQLEGVRSDFDSCERIRTMPPSVTTADFVDSLQFVRASALTQVAVVKSPLKDWALIGGMDSAKAALMKAIISPIVHRASYRRMGILPSSGVLLYGPPGTGKTMLAQAVAGIAMCAFIPVNIADIVHGAVGETEKSLRNIFTLAQQVAPCVLFFDEIQSIFGSRDDEGAGGSQLVSEFFTQLDALRNDAVPRIPISSSFSASSESAPQVVILAATNIPELLDPALLRPGRIDTLVYVGPPDAKGRKEIIERFKCSVHWSDDVDVNSIVVQTEGYTGAEIKELCERAGFEAIKRVGIDAIESQILAGIPASTSSPSPSSSSSSSACLNAEEIKVEVRGCDFAFLSARETNQHRTARLETRFRAWMRKYNLKSSQ